MKQWFKFSMLLMGIVRVESVQPSTGRTACLKGGQTAHDAGSDPPRRPACEHTVGRECHRHE